MTGQTNPNDIILLCDEAQDKELFLQIRSIHKALAQIPEENVRTYEQARVNDLSKLAKATTPLHQDDRPDWIFCVGDSPVLVVELTRHAYTGDNGLQRFARFAAAAENGTPFIYFGPLARVRDDELDGGFTPSPRRLTSHLFAGMRQLSSIYQTPQLYVPWPTDHAGLPASLPFRPTLEDISTIYGQLLTMIGSVLFESLHFARHLEHPIVKAAQEEVTALAAQSNTRSSDVVFSLCPSQMASLLSTPAQFYTLMTARENYFFKGKPDKLLAAHALQRSALNFVMGSDGKTLPVHPLERSKVVNRILSHPLFSNKAVVYYTGYKWRSDPHCGAFVNLRYRLTNSKLQDTKGRDAYILLYPRISLNTTRGVGEELATLSYAAPGGIRELFAVRYGAKEGKDKMNTCLSSDRLYGRWANTTKQARLFRRYADLVILNDGVIVGEKLDLCF